MNIYYLLFKRPDGTTYPVEIAADNQEQAIAYIEKRDGSTFQQNIIFA